MEGAGRVIQGSQRRTGRHRDAAALGVVGGWQRFTILTVGQAGRGVVVPHGHIEHHAVGYDVATGDLQFATGNHVDAGLEGDITSGDVDF